MKILFAAPFDGAPGGILRWAQHIYAYYNEIEPANIELVPFSLGRSRFININQSLFYRIFYSIKDYTKLLKSYKSHLKKTQYDIVHISSSASISLIKDLYMIHLAHSYGMKAIVHFHFGRIPELKHKNNWEWNILKKVITSADKIIVLDKNSYTTLLASNFSNVEIVPNPVAPEIINQIDNIIDIKRMPGTILFVGHVVKTKGIFELIEACKTISNIKVKLIGHISDSMKSAIKSVAGYNNEQWLDIMGELSYKEVIVEMCKCDIFVLPTYTEGFPNVILESMASGCAIITTKVGAIPEMLEIDEKGKYCTFVDVGNIEQLKTAITNLLYNEKIKIELRKNVYRRVRERYSMPIIWEMLENIWRNLNN